jgi:hypothetical protein
MSKKLPKISANMAHDKILQNFLPTQLLPDEDPETYGALRDALILNLIPVTPYERILAEQLVTLEWESLRHRRLRDALLMAEYRDQSVGAFQEGVVGRFDGLLENESAKNLAYDLVSTNINRHTRAMQALEAAQITPTEILAKAYKSLFKELEMHERHIAEIEVRRRKLRDDYDRLKTTRALPVQEAEVVGEE